MAVVFLSGVLLFEPIFDRTAPLAASDGTSPEVRLGHRVYGFLDRMETKGILYGLRDGTRPLTRLEVARRLIEVERRMDGRMTEIDRQILAWLSDAFQYEVGHLKGRKTSRYGGKWRALSYSNRDGLLSVEPFVNGDAIWRTNSEPAMRNLYNVLLGLRAFGYFKGTMAFYFQGFDANDFGRTSDFQRREGPEPGWGYVKVKGDSNIVNYEEVNAHIAFRIGPFEGVVGKGRNAWGPSPQTNLHLTSKAPSYPEVKLQAAFNRRLRFTYLHASLVSGLIDSSRSFGGERELERAKYLAAHRIEWTVTPGLDIGLSESVIYGDRGPELAYLIPVMFFWSAEHDLGNRDNVQLGMDFDLHLIPNVKFYGALYLDEWTIETTFSREKSHNWIAWQIGAFAADLGGWMRDLDFLLEYTRLAPQVYTHKYPINAYESWQHPLGHWLGRDADELHLGWVYRPHFRARIAVAYDRRRKGAPIPPLEFYADETIPFLSGAFQVTHEIAMEGRYEVFRDGFVGVGLTLREVKDSVGLAHNGRTSSFHLGFSYNL